MPNAGFLSFVSRAPDQVLLLHRPQKHPGHCAQGHHALPGQLRQGQPPVRAGLLTLQAGSDRPAALRVGTHRAKAEGGRGNAPGAREKRNICSKIKVGHFVFPLDVIAAENAACFFGPHLANRCPTIES